MRRRKPRTPSYRLHSASGQGIVSLSGRDHYLGKWNTAASRREYDRILAEWLQSGRRLAGRGADPDAVTVNEVMAAYLRFARTYYSRDGIPTREVAHVEACLGAVRDLYGKAAAADFGPIALKAVRAKMIEKGHARKYVNGNVGRIKRVFKWAVENEMVPPSTLHGLQAVAGLRRGRTEAADRDPIRPVADEDVDAVLPFLTPPVRAMVELQRLTGMRSGEVIAMRACDIDMSGALWLYQPKEHKTAHHGHARVVELGPRSQAILEPFLKRETEAYLFSPAEADAAVREARHAARKTPLSCGNRPGSHVVQRRPKRSPGDRYTTNSYRRSIVKAIPLVNAKRCPKDHIPHWHPHQLRHSFATMIRREHGIELARIILGHRTAFTTEIYAEVDRQKAREVMAKIG